MRLGLIKISGSLYRHNYDDIKHIFDVVRPERIEHRPYENDIYYLYGICDAFEDLTEGAAVPQYDAVITAGEKEIKFNKF